MRLGAYLFALWVERCDGHVEKAAYRQVIAEITGHREAVEVKSLGTFFHLIDPTDPRGQFCDFGESYTNALYAGTPEELRLAEAAKAEVAVDAFRGPDGQA